MEKTISGSDAIDGLLSGGYENDVVTTIFGPAGSGKTTMCLLCAIGVARKKKVIYLDTEGGFSAERFSQLCEDPGILKKIFLLKPLSFADQHKMAANLAAMITEQIGLVVVDTISMHYRIEIGKAKDRQQVNNQMGNQISMLSEIARKHGIPVLVTNQVYSDFDERDKVRMVGGDILAYSSKCLIELEKGKSGMRKAVIKKHRSIAEGKEVTFEIREKGFFAV